MALLPDPEDDGVLSDIWAALQRLRERAVSGAPTIPRRGSNVGPGYQTRGEQTRAVDPVSAGLLVGGALPVVGEAMDLYDLGAGAQRAFTGDVSGGLLQAGLGGAGLLLPGIAGRSFRNFRGRKYYSRLEEALEKFPQETTTPGDLKRYLEKQGVPQAEINWVLGDVDDLATTVRGRYGKERKSLRMGDVREQVVRNRVQLDETVYGAGGGSAHRDPHVIGDELSDNTGEFDDLFFNHGIAGDESLYIMEDAVESAASGRDAIEGLRRFHPEAYERLAAADELDLFEQFADRRINLNMELAEAEDVMSSGTRYEDWTEPGGENYREVLLRQQNREATNLPQRERVSRSRDFTHTHWPNQENVVGHLRLKDIPPPFSGRQERGLRVEEVQSDWGQAGRDEGFGMRGSAEEIQALEKKKEEINAAMREKQAEMTRIEKHLPEGWVGEVMGGFPYTTKNIPFADRYLQLNDQLSDIVSEMTDVSVKLNELKKVRNPDMPWRDTDDWLGLLSRRVLDEAAEGDYDFIEWTPGAKQAERYNLRRHVEELRYDPQRGKLSGYARRPGNQSLLNVIEKNVPAEELDQYVGPEIAGKLQREGVASGVDLEIGGEGHIEFYDKLFPSQMQKAAKAAGGELEELSRTYDVDYGGGPLNEAEAIQLLNLRRGMRERDMGAFPEDRFGLRETPEGTFELFNRKSGNALPMPRTLRVERPKPASWRSDVENKFRIFEQRERPYPRFRMTPELRERIKQGGQYVLGTGGLLFGPRAFQDFWEDDEQNQRRGLLF